MNVAKIIEVVASSKTGWEDAVRAGVEDAGRTIRGIRGVEYKANLKIAFSVEE
jgi:flavin-binding protein dodecin